MASGRHLLSLKQDRKTVSELTLSEAADLSRQRGGSQVTLYEYLDEDHYYVPYGFGSLLPEQIASIAGISFGCKIECRK